MTVEQIISGLSDAPIPTAWADLLPAAYLIRERLPSGREIIALSPAGLAAQAAAT